MCGSLGLPSTLRVHLTSVLNWGKPSALGPRQIVESHPLRPEPLLLLQRTGREQRKQGPLQMVSQLWQLVLCKALSYLWPAKPVVLAVGVGRQAHGCPLLISQMWDTRQNLRPSVSDHPASQTILLNGNLVGQALYLYLPHWQHPSTAESPLKVWRQNMQLLVCFSTAPSHKQDHAEEWWGELGREEGSSFPLGNGHCDHNAGTHGACAETLAYGHAQTYSCLGSSLSCYPFYSSTAVNYDPLSCKWVSKIFSKIYSTDCMLIQ